MEICIYNSFCQLVGDRPAIVDSTLQNLLSYEKNTDFQIFQVLNSIKRLKVKKQENPENKQIGIELRNAYYALKQLQAEKHVCWYFDGAFPTGHLNIVKKALNSLNQPYSERDFRKPPKKNRILAWNNRPDEMRYYQKAAFDQALVEHRGVFEMAVGSGKSLLMAYLTKEFSTVTLIVVPSLALSEQIYANFASWFGQSKVQILDSATVRKGKLRDIRIVVVNTLASLVKTGEIHLALQDVNVLLIDEFHHAGAATYVALLPHLEHIYYRFGFTGTFLRNDGSELDMHGVLSNRLYHYPAKQAIKDGFLTPITVKFHEIEGIRKLSYQQEYDANYGQNNEFLRKIKEIAEASLGRQVLTLVKKKEKTGNIIHNYLESKGISNVYISGDNHKKEIKAAIKDFNDCTVPFLIGSAVVGEGIDIRSTDELIMAQGDKSETVIVQAVGRAVRLFDGKKQAVIHDFYFNGTKHMQKHAKMRMEIYERNFGCQIEKV